MKFRFASGLFYILLGVSAFAQSAATPSIEASGEVRASVQIEVKPQIAGTIKKLYVRAGDSVAVGDLLLELGDQFGEQKHSKVRATKSGAILSVSVIEKQSVFPATDLEDGTTLMAIGNPSSLIVQARLPERDAAKVDLKQTVWIASKALPGKQIKGVICFIAPLATTRDSVKSITILAKIEEPGVQLQPGMKVQLSIPLAPL